MFALDPLFRRFIRHGHLVVTDHQGQVHHYGDRAAPADAAIRLHTPQAAWRIARNPAYNIGAAYTDGEFSLQQGTLLNFVGVLLRNLAEFNSKPSVRLLYRLEELATIPAILNWATRSRRNVAHHYDLSGALFSLFLDSDRQYSCAYFREGHETIDAAQLAKKQHIAAKLLVHPGHHILDIGSGWGGLALYLASHYPNVRVTGLTLSEEQYRVATERARQAGLGDRVTFKLTDYRLEDGTYDRIVSVGMFEHVGRPQFTTFFEKVKSLLKPDGVALLHSIGFQTPPASINPWLRRNIFPGAYLPALSQLSWQLEKRGFWLTDLETLRLHYAHTLAAWHQRFQANRAKIMALYDERFCRMWEYYLQSCEAGFRWSGLTVFQIQMAKTIGAVPITRDYMVQEEARLREVDAAEAPPVQYRAGQAAFGVHSQA
jgi:cyclopropane-fatty-acyl-phospholipid synthase